jgi:hypothetical protein
MNLIVNQFNATTQWNKDAGIFYFPLRLSSLASFRYVLACSK